MLCPQCKIWEIKLESNREDMCLWCGYDLLEAQHPVIMAMVNPMGFEAKPVVEPEPEEEDNYEDDLMSEEDIDALLEDDPHPLDEKGVPISLIGEVLYVGSLSVTPSGVSYLRFDVKMGTMVLEVGCLGQVAKAVNKYVKVGHTAHVEGIVHHGPSGKYVHADKVSWRVGS